MSSNLCYVISDDNIMLFVDGKQYNISSNEAPYKKLKKVLLMDISNKYDKVKELLSEIQTKIVKVCDSFEIINGIVYIDKIPVNNSIGTLLNKIYETEDNFDPFVNFIKNVRQNPNKEIIDQICDFIEKSYEDGGFSITEDGYIVAYKHVDKDYKDTYSRTFYNAPGTTVEMNRDDVCADRNKTCAAGLHFCSASYLSEYSDGGKTIVLKINPKDVVSIPVDYNNAKGRCCKYTVIDEIEDSQVSRIQKQPVITLEVEITNNSDLFNLYNKVATILKNNVTCNVTNLYKELADISTFKELQSEFSKFCILEKKVPSFYKHEKISKVQLITKQIEYIANVTNEDVVKILGEFLGYLIENY